MDCIVDQQALADLFCEMVRIDSESSNETVFMNFLRELFTQRLEATCVSDQYGNLIARVPAIGSMRESPILLGAHADTVKPGEAIEPVILDGVIRSAGNTVLGADDKAGIAEIVGAVQNAKARPQIEILITKEEEIGLKGVKNLAFSLLQSSMGFVIDTQALDAVVVGGPTHYFLDVEVIGKAAHAGQRPEEGISAIVAAAKAIAEVPDGRIDVETTANVGTIHGGKVRNSVPERVRIQVECRSLDHGKATDLAESIRLAFERAASSMGAVANVAVDLQYAAASVPLDSLPVQVARKALQFNGLKPRVMKITGGNDAVILNAKGIQTVVLGFGGKNAHTVQEQISIEDMKKAAGVIGKILELLA